MITEIRVLRNTFFLTLQPLLLNFLSLFVIGYIARMLGMSDFGIFNFVIFFIMLFFPVGRMGLDNVSIRELASIKDSKEDAEEYASKILTCRIIFILFSAFVVVVTSLIIGYNDRMLYAVWGGVFILLFQLLCESLSDIFKSFERMEFVAVAHLISGLTLTILSVAILYMGWGLFTLIGVYSFGHMLGSIVALYFLVKYFMSIRVSIDLGFFKKALLGSMPFFFTSAMWYSMMRLDTIFLSNAIPAEELGIYTAAIMLVTKLSIIPQGLGGALYPAMSNLYSTGKHEEMNEVIRNYFSYILVIVLPVVILVSFYSYQVVTVIFGAEYVSAGVILRYAVWVLMIRCFAFMEFSILAATRKQNLILLSYMITMVLCVAMNITLTLGYGMMGALVTFVSTQLILLFLFTLFLLRSVPRFFHSDILVKGLTLNGIIAACLHAFDPYFSSYNYIYGFFVLSFLILLCYLFGLFVFRMVQPSDILKLRSIVRAR